MAVVRSHTTTDTERDDRRTTPALAQIPGAARANDSRPAEAHLDGPPRRDVVVRGDLDVAATRDTLVRGVLAAATGGTPLAAVPVALDRSHFVRLSLAGDLRATVRLLQHPELVLGTEGADVDLDTFVPSRVHRTQRVALYERLVAQAASAHTLETVQTLERVGLDRRTGWLDSVGALTVLLEIERAHGSETVGRRAVLERVRLILREGAGVQRFEGAAARLLSGLRFAPEHDIATAAEDLLWRLAHLRTGVTAPPLCGNDPEGNELCLHEFRGRIVLLRFWSADDPDFEHSAARDAGLVDLFWDHPFSFIGINRDADRERYLRQREEFGFAGNQIYEGPLDEDLIEEVRIRRAQRPSAFESWREHATGGTYLIDSHGVIRAVDPSDDQLEELIRALVGDHYRETRARGF